VGLNLGFVQYNINIDLVHYFRTLFFLKDEEERLGHLHMRR